jgi:hypothetical protein
VSGEKIIDPPRLYFYTYEGEKKLKQQSYGHNISTTMSIVVGPDEN